MKTVFDQTTRLELTGRIDTITENSTPKWGKMNAYQMLKHCALADEMFLGKKKYERVLIGMIMGRFALRNMLKDETPMSKNAPTSPFFKIAEEKGDIAAEKTKWINFVNEYATFSNPNFIHWFFGPMTEEQIGYFAYKHADHHLRQFNS